MNEGEALRIYAKRYWEAYNEIDECNEQLVVMQFKFSLPREDRLRQSLMKRSAQNIQELMLRIEKYARLEEDVLLQVPTAKVGITTVKKEAKKQKKEEGATRGKKKDEKVFTVFKDPLYKILPLIHDKPFFK